MALKEHGRPARSFFESERTESTVLPRPMGVVGTVGETPTLLEAAARHHFISCYVDRSLEYPEFPLYSLAEILKMPPLKSGISAPG